VLGVVRGDEDEDSDGGDGEDAATTGDADAAAPTKNPHAVALGRLGGKKGGRARAAKLSSAERTAIAQRAAKARWAKKEGEE